MKPNLFIVGAIKCGTTAWFEYLGTHPDIFVPEIKEPHYFAADMPGRRWTQSRARYERLFAGADGARIAGEASVMYLYSKAAPALIHEFNPDAKILIFLRRQEDFLPSLHHQFVFSFTDDIEDFETAWRLSGKRPWGSVPKTCPDPKMLDYAAMGRFHEQVARYFDQFPPAQIKVIHFDEWTSDPRSTYLGILDFLGLEDDGRTHFPRINEAKAFRIKWLGKLITHPPRILRAVAWLLRWIAGREVLGLADRAANLISTRGYRTRVSPELREEIKAYYEEDNRQLAGLLAHPTSGDGLMARTGEPSPEAEPFRPHRIEWSPERIRRFWDHYSSNPAMEDDYFAKSVGKSLVNYVRRRIAIGTAVDVGCGRGDLMEFLMRRGHDVYGVDQSPASVNQVQTRYAGRPRFKGAALVSGQIDLPDGSADTAFLVEVVEHLNDDALASTLHEAHRIIRPGGHLVLTTPNDEDLRASETMCPECGGIYHRLQHVRAWSAKSLSDYVRSFGFEALSAEGTVLAPHVGPLGIAYGLAYRAVRQRKPHLIYIGCRPPD